MGAYKEKITEDQLIGYLEQFSEAPTTTIKFKRKNFDSDNDDDDLEGL